MTPELLQQIEQVKAAAASFNNAVRAIDALPEGRNIQIQCDVLNQAVFGRLYDLPLLQVKLSEVKTL